MFVYLVPKSTCNAQHFELFEIKLRSYYFTSALRSYLLEFVLNSEHLVAESTIHHRLQPLRLLRDYSSYYSLQQLQQLRLQQLSESPALWDRSTRLHAKYACLRPRLPRDRPCASTSRSLYALVVFIRTFLPIFDPSRPFEPPVCLNLFIFLILPFLHLQNSFRNTFCSCFLFC